MTDVVGRGTIELVADARQLKASIEDAKKSIRTLGEGQKDISKAASASIDNYIGRMQMQNAVVGKTRTETELYKLALRGASQEQIAAATSALKFNENHQATARLVSSLNTGLIAAASATALFAGGLAAMVISSINAADHLHDLNKATGISVEDLSGLALAAKQSGADLDTVAESISKLSKNIGKDPEKYRQLGITAKEPLEAFKQLADIFVAIEDPQLRAALGATAIGKGWMTAGPLLAEGGKAIGEMVEKGRQLSNVTGEMADGADKFNDSLAELKATSTGIATKFAGEMLPAFNQIIAAIKVSYEESGKLAALWTAMGSLGAFLFTDEFAGTRTKIKSLQKDLEDLETSKRGLEKNAPGGGFIADWLFGKREDLDAKIAQTKADIASLLKSLEPKAAVGKPDAPKGLRDRVSAFVATGSGSGKSSDDAAKERQKLLDMDAKNFEAYWEARVKSAQEANDQIGAIESDAYKENQRLIAEQMAGLDNALAISMQNQVDIAEALNFAYLEAQVKAHKKESDTITEFWKSAAHNMQSAMSGFFFDVMQGNLKDLAGGFKRTIDQMVANMLAAKAATALFGKDSDQGTGGLIGKAIEWFKGSGGATGGLGEGAAGTWGAGAGFANGGSFTVGGRGGLDTTPVRFMATPGERVTVTPAGQGVPMSVVMHFSISGQTDRRSQAQIAAAAGMGVQRALARNT